MEDFWKLDHDTVILILEHYHDLATGARLVNDVGNSETRGDSSHTVFEESCMLAAEVARRVRRCGQDGMIVEERYGLNLMAAPKDVEQIADERVMLDTEIYRIIKKVAWYCTGRNAKQQDYEDWKAGRHYRRKNLIISH